MSDRLPGRIDAGGDVSSRSLDIASSYLTRAVAAAFLAMGTGVVIP